MTVGSFMVVRKLAVSPFADVSWMLDGEVAVSGWFGLVSLEEEVPPRRCLVFLRSIVLLCDGEWGVGMQVMH